MAGASSGGKKTAVVVVHGMGEQRPMDTLWGLVSALWTHDPDVCQRNFTYSKPDNISGSFELRRVTTGRGLTGARFDFFELYWAHLMQGNTVDSVVAAVRTLIVRAPRSVPRRLLPVWLVSWLVVLAISGVLLGAAFSALPSSVRDCVLQHLGVGDRRVPGYLWLGLPVLAAGLRMVGKAWIGPVAGDAARYLSATPPNVGARQTIREAAVDLIEKLHASDAYDRIILVGHSLGTVIAYDALNFAWGRLKAKAFTEGAAAHPDAMAALNRLEATARTLEAASGEAVGPARVAYRAAQRAYFAELSRFTHRPEDDRGEAAAARPVWLVSDFVSTGSPLSKADVLMARDQADFQSRRVRRRELPACPPQMEGKARPQFSYPARSKVRSPHHAAVFGPTVWTNVYFETQGIVLGDVIGGRVAPLFGEGALDVRIRRGGSIFRHLDYWKDPAGAHPWLKALRRAANLNLADEAELWGAQATAAEIAAERL